MKALIVFFLLSLCSAKLNQDTWQPRLKEIRIYLRDGGRNMLSKELFEDIVKRDEILQDAYWLTCDPYHKWSNQTVSESQQLERSEILIYNIWMRYIKEVTENKNKLKNRTNNKATQK